MLCSTATRARETLDRTGIDASPDTKVGYVERLYDATPATVIDEINGVDAAVETLLVIGHEPAMAQVALGLAGAEGTNPAAVEHISTKFPTSSIAVLRTSDTWDRLEPGGAALVTFHIPRY